MISISGSDRIVLFVIIQDSGPHNHVNGGAIIYLKKININTALAGQPLGIKEVDEGIWLASFIDYDLGYIDLEQRTLQPIDNPFGPGVSPMS